jgi:hypoxanthine phosphoribosyltransferase
LDNCIIDDCQLACLGYFDSIRNLYFQNDASTGSVEVIGGDNLNLLEGKNVLVVEDIIDTGNTMTHLLKLLTKHNPKKIRVAR